MSIDPVKPFDGLDRCIVGAWLVAAAIIAAVIAEAFPRETRAAVATMYPGLARSIGE